MEESCSELRCQTKIANVPLDVISWRETFGRISKWANAHESRYVCLCNVHSVVTCQRDDDLYEAICSADLVLPDGAPVALMMRLEGFSNQARISGPDLMWLYCQEAENTGETMFLFGATEQTLALLRGKLIKEFPRLRIVGSYAPPFGIFTPSENRRIVAQLNASGARIVWVALGCPKQEKWMNAHRGKVKAVMIGVGAAFDFHSGRMRRAPKWAQRFGLEWLHRLLSDPRRLWKRYVVTNTAFLIVAAKQLLRREDRDK